MAGEAPAATSRELCGGIARWGPRECALLAREALRPFERELHQRPSLRGPLRAARVLLARVRCGARPANQDELGLVARYPEGSRAARLARLLELAWSPWSSERLERLLAELERLLVERDPASGPRGVRGVLLALAWWTLAEDRREPLPDLWEVAPGRWRGDGVRVPAHVLVLRGLEDLRARTAAHARCWPRDRDALDQAARRAELALAVHLREPASLLGVCPSLGAVLDDLRQLVSPGEHYVRDLLDSLARALPGTLTRVALRAVASDARAPMSCPVSEQLELVRRRDGLSSVWSRSTPHA